MENDNAPKFLFAAFSRNAIRSGSGSGARLAIRKPWGTTIHSTSFGPPLSGNLMLKWRGTPFALFVCLIFWRQSGDKTRIGAFLYANRRKSATSPAERDIGAFTVATKMLSSTPNRTILYY